MIAMHVGIDIVVKIYLSIYAYIYGIIYMGRGALGIFSGCRVPALMS